jgi:hypothetical protein
LLKGVESKEDVTIPVIKFEPLILSKVNSRLFSGKVMLDEISTYDELNNVASLGRIMLLNPLKQLDS